MLLFSSERILGLLTLARQLLRICTYKANYQIYCGYSVLRWRIKNYQRNGFRWETTYKFTVSWCIHLYSLINYARTSLVTVASSEQIHHGDMSGHLSNKAQVVDVHMKNDSYQTSFGNPFWSKSISILHLERSHVTATLSTPLHASERISRPTSACPLLL